MLASRRSQRRSTVLLCAALIAGGCGEAETRAPSAAAPPAVQRAEHEASRRAMSLRAEGVASLDRTLGALAAPPAAAAKRLPISARRSASSALSPDERTVVTLRAPGDEDDEARWKVVLWDLETGTERAAISPAGELRPRGVAFRADGEKIAVVLAETGVDVLSAADGRALFRIADADPTIDAAIFTPDGSGLLLFAFSDVERRDAESGVRTHRVKLETPFEGPPEIPSCASSGDGDEPSSGPPSDGEGTPPSEGEPGSPPGEGPKYCAHDVHADASFLTPSGSFLVEAVKGRATEGPFAKSAMRVQLRSPVDLSPGCAFAVDPFSTIVPASFSPDDRLAVFVPDAFLDDPDYFVDVRELATCQRPEGASAEAAPVMAWTRFVAVSPTGLAALVAGDAYTAELWRVTGIDPPAIGLAHVLATERAVLHGAAFSADGQRVALHFSNGTLQTFDTATGRLLSSARIPGRRGDVLTATFLSDGKRALVPMKGSGGSSAALVDTDSGQILRRFE